MGGRAAVILAAGQGVRMKSSTPKVLHKVGGKAMLDWSIDLALELGCERIVVVASPAGDAVRAHAEAALGPGGVAIQDPPLGTAHAVRAAEGALAGFDGDVVVLYGDTPLIPAAAVEGLFRALAGGSAVGVLGFEASDPGAYGRLIVSPGGALERIVEAREASPDELAVRLCNSGVMAAAADRMFRLLAKVGNNNAKGEYYLTDLVGLARAEGGDARAALCNEADVLGVNSRAELAAAEAAFQVRRRSEALAAGVTMIAPETVFFSHDTTLAADIVIEPNVVFGPGVSIGPGALIRGFCHIEEADIGPDADLGPFTRIRGGSTLRERARVGAFVEMKASDFGAGAKANHLAYLGDGLVGAGVNIGAGVIFCNYDGFDKHRTVIDTGAFIGSNSALVAPVSIGAGGYVGSGSVITEDVAPNALGLGRARQVERPGWAKAYREKRSTDGAD